MDHIPIKFEYQGKEYSGSFSKVMGAGSTSTFHLSVNKYHWGQLLNTDNGWKFFSNSKPELAEKAEEWGEYIMLWYG